MKASTAAPSTWSRLPLKRLLAERDERGDVSREVLSVYRDHGVVRKASREDNFNKTPDDLSLYKSVNVGDLVVNKMKAWQGSLGVSAHRGIVSGDYLVCGVGTGVDRRFLHHALRSSRYIAEMGSRSVGIRPSQWRLYWEDLAGIEVALPTIDTQRAIATFLDTELDHIDQLVAKKRRLLELVDERIDAQVRGLVGRSPLGKGGDVELVPARRVLTKLERWTDGGDVVTAFRDGEVTTRAHRDRDGFTNAWTDDPRVQRVDVGDVVVHGLDGFSGAIGDAQRAGVCSPVYHVCNANGGDSTFYGRLLRQLALTGYLGSFATSTRERAVDLRNWDLFGRIPIPFAPLQEQRSIGDAIRKARPLRDKVLESEALAREHRQALITAAVTGQIDVPKAVA